MAPRNRPAVRNDAVAAIDHLFGGTAGWNDAQARASEANDVAEQIYALRVRHGLTQKELADRAATAQSVIARLEDANYEGHSMAMLKRIASAVGERVRVHFEKLAGDREVPIVPAKRARVIARERAAPRGKVPAKASKRPAPRLARAR